MRYELQEKLSEDELFEVWSGRVAGTSTNVKIERLRPHLRPTSEVLDQLKQAAAGIAAPGTEPLLAWVTQDGPQPYWVFSDEPFLYANQALELAGGTIPAEVVVVLMRELSKTLARLRPGLAHVLIDDANIGLHTSGAVVLRHMSLCVARFRLSAAVQERARRFTAPEIWESAAADERSAVFALGCMAHHLATGKSPWDPDAGEIRIDPALGAELRAILSACLSLRPSGRFPSLGALSESLTRLLTQQGILEPARVLEGWLALLDSSQEEMPAQRANMFDALELFGGTDKDPAIPTKRPPTEVVRNDWNQAIETEVGAEAPNAARSVEEEQVEATPVRPQQSRDPLIGMVLHGYRLERLIGAGSFSRVYLAQHLHLPRQAAIKVLRGDMSASKVAKSRMSREANALAGLRHPNIVSLLDFGMAPSGLPFMIMELLEGRPLSEVLKEGPIAPARAADFGLQIAEGLAAAHALGFVHRDLKPANVMVVGPLGKETLKILDFGVTRERGFEGSRLTRFDQLVGTPLYMAPDQIESASEAEPSADLYSLGVMMYEMLAGRPPFGGDFNAVIDAQLNAAPPPLPPSLGLEGLILELLAKSPRERPASAEVVSKRIRALFPEGPTAPVRPATEPPLEEAPWPGSAVRVVHPVTSALEVPAPARPSPSPPLRSWWIRLTPFISLAMAALALWMALQARGRGTPTPPPPIRTSTTSV
ncbi:MAG: serine/threonine-protein kinase [Myxococcota bacterium]